MFRAWSRVRVTFYACGHVISMQSEVASEVSHDMLGELSQAFVGELNAALGHEAVWSLQSGAFLSSMAKAYTTGHTARCRDIISNTDTLRADIHVSHVNLHVPWHLSSTHLSLLSFICESLWPILC